jgi:hypothetical protein
MATSEGELHSDFTSSLCNVRTLLNSELWNRNLALYGVGEAVVLMLLGLGNQHFIA